MVNIKSRISENDYFQLEIPLHLLTWFSYKQFLHYFLKFPWGWFQVIKLGSIKNKTA